MNIKDILEEHKKIAIIILIVAILILAGYFIHTGSKTKESEVETVENVVETEAEIPDYDYCKLNIYDENNSIKDVFEIKMIDGKSYIFNNSKNMGESSIEPQNTGYVKELKSSENKDLKVDEDTQINDYFNTSWDDALAYINYLKANGNHIITELEMPKFTEVILKDDTDSFIRCIASDSGLLFKNLGKESIFDINYYKNTYIK